ncbi:Major facilitator superfamily domain, general substrate transporter [Cynara cardunculus var. scolymus]|uniref:Major facilitator superfamily domain, general substrate transporter n=1 Tax=Cynara cardunculus var. scolymus TaxID=59895 RepID=A0A103XUE7_CYNCS|nr:Major facilitator superfamily domain, general substrate transporter [Cynara cardunculus var. scolymus]
MQNVKTRLLDECTRDGSLDWHGKPAVKRKTGGWKSGMLLLVNEGLATLAFTGVEVNMVLFSKSVLRQSNAESANMFSNWMGSVYLFSLLGAFLSDSYLGRYLTCGLVALSLTTQAFMLQPKGCGRIGELCNAHSPLEIAIFYVSIYLIALGNGGAEPALATFGADQFDEEDPQEKQAKTTFLSYFYVALNLGSLISETLLVYIETMGLYVVAFWISTLCSFIALMSLVSGSFRYRQFKPSGNPISRFSQVIVASVKKIKLQGQNRNVTPCNYSFNPNKAEELHQRRPFLDRASIMTPDDGQNPHPWRLCTVTQVEEVKCVLRLLPIWLCTILSSVVFIQMISLFVEQGAAMDRGISNFHIPPASMTIFDIISTSAFIICYDKLILPLYVKITKKKPNPPSELQRMGIGLAIATVAIITAGVVEHHRLKYASKGPKETSSLSIFWQTPQYVLVGIAEAFTYVAQWEFFAAQVPDKLKSIGLGLSMCSSAMGSYTSSIILSVVMKITSKDGKPGWVPANLNDGHLDRFFYLCAALTAINLVLFVSCAKRYKNIVVERRDEAREIN